MVKVMLEVCVTVDGARLASGHDEGEGVSSLLGVAKVVEEAVHGGRSIMHTIKLVREDAIGDASLEIKVSEVKGDRVKE